MLWLLNIVVTVGCHWSTDLRERHVFGRPGLRWEENIKTVLKKANELV